MAPVHLCAYCREHPVEHEWRPFCSERCKMLDLAKWLDGDYRVAGDRAGIGDQGSGIRNQGSGIRDQESGIGDQGSGIRDKENGTPSRDQ